MSQHQFSMKILRIWQTWFCTMLNISQTMGKVSECAVMLTNLLSLTYFFVSKNNKILIPLFIFDLCKLNSQVGLSLNFNSTLQQWANLTALYRTPCLWKPSDCTSGATLAMWMKANQSGGQWEGILSTVDYEWRIERWIIHWKNPEDLQYTKKFDTIFSAFLCFFFGETMKYWKH